MSLNLADWSLDDLKKLEVAIPHEIRRRQATERKAVLKEVEAFVKGRGFTLDMLRKNAPGRGRAYATKGVAKYRHPEKPELTWSGKGRKPRWFEVLLTTHDASELLI